jgi:AcrR family transcriptional regulator
MAKKDSDARVIDAFLTLLAEHDYAAVSLGMIAGRAGITLGELRTAFDGKTAILAAFARSIDRQVLDGIDPQMADETPRERLFDVLMRRIDALVPHKAAIRTLNRALRADPALALDWFPIALRTHLWMLTAAEIDTAGLRGALAARGAVIAFGRVVRVWLDDEDPGMARTMAALDRELRRAESAMRRLDDLASLTSPFRAVARRLCERRPPRSHTRDPDADAPPRPTTH